MGGLLHPQALSGIAQALGGGMQQQGQMPQQNPLAQLFAGITGGQQPQPPGQAGYLQPQQQPMVNMGQPQGPMGWQPGGQGPQGMGPTPMMGGNPMANLQGIGLMQSRPMMETHPIFGNNRGFEMPPQRGPIAMPDPSPVSTSSVQPPAAQPQQEQQFFTKPRGFGKEDY